MSDITIFNAAYLNLYGKSRINVKSKKNNELSSYSNTLNIPSPAPDNSFITFSSPDAFTLEIGATNKTWDGTLMYSIDKVFWKTLNDVSLSISSSQTGNTKYLYLRGSNNTHLSSAGQALTFTGIFQLTGTNIRCDGNIETLLDYETVLNNQHPTMSSYAFIALFFGDSSLTSAPTLPSTALTEGCYNGMFAGCTSLTTAPKLPAITLAKGCYTSMFKNCTSLNTLVELSATTLAESCYSTMFDGCTNIKISETQTGDYQTPYRIPATGTGTDSSISGLNNMFLNTGGTFRGTPTINTTYYTSNTIIS